ncbi:hypothetical protein EC973_003089 [Apophysomyces ossiformis]|uniref:Uncharacterized protein n=1 Tax=Apophysomyces ossiformis TaxID=679940 RepID=A0A8H7BLV0_9FUNG|nr:hypothetical protein EC973_003089 [Apophysomyces ossiformis]
MKADDYLDENDDSFSSNDFTPRSKKRTFILADAHSDKVIDDNVSDTVKCETWNSCTVLTSEQSLYYNQCKKHRELTPARILDTPQELIDIAYCDLVSASDYISKVPADILFFINDILDACYSKDESKIMSVLGSNMVKAAESTRNKEVLLKASNVLMDLTRQLTRQMQHHQLHQYQQYDGRYGEDTFVHQLISPFLNNIFYGPNLGYKWANSQLAACSTSPSTASAQSTSPRSLAAESRLSSPSESLASESSDSSSKPIQKKKKKYLPDYTLYAYVRDLRFDLLTVEIRQPGTGQGQGDLQKIAQEMKMMIDSLVENGIESPIVCSIWVNGFECHTYKMDLKYDGVYRLIELDNFTLVSSIEDLAKVFQLE